MTISADIKPHETYLRNGIRIRYAAEIADRTLLFLPLNPADGASAWTPTETEWEKELAAGKIKRFFVIRDAKGDVVRDATQIEIAPSKNETEKENRARSLFFFMKRWHQRKASGTISLHHPALDDLVHDEDNLEAAKKLGLGWLPASGTLHRWLIKYPDIETLTARFVISRSGEGTRQHWHPKVADLLEEIIHWYWEPSLSKRDYTDAYAEFDARFEALAIELALDPSLKTPLEKPSEGTIRAFIDSAECYETVKTKFGEPAADARFKGNRHPIQATRLLEVVMIDSTILDAWCCLDDESLLPLGRPTLTIAIDLYTRMILAVIVTFEPPSLFTAMACLKRVNTPKHDINVRWPHIERVSDGWGKPKTIIVDNELAQTGKSYQAACEDGKIHVKWAPVKRPQYKAVVERFFLTLKMMLLDKLPGGLPYKPAIMSQLGIDPAQISTITMSKLVELINQTINDVYHYDTHTTIGMPPALAWEKSKAKHKRPFIDDPDFLEAAFGALEDGTLTTSGIEFDRMVFHDPVITGALLNDLGKDSPKRRRRGILASANPRVMFKYNPVNMEAIYVWNSKCKQYVKLPNAAGEAARGLSKWHWQILRIWAEQENIAFVTPAEQLAARRRVRENIEATIPSEAFKAIKRQRRILYEPSEILEGKTVCVTTATATVGGMGPDDIEIDVARHGPEGDRIPPKGPARGRTKPKRKLAAKLRQLADDTFPSPQATQSSTARDAELSEIARAVFASRGKE
jgi:putative transposase